MIIGNSNKKFQLSLLRSHSSSSYPCNNDGISIRIRHIDLRHRSEQTCHITIITGRSHGHIEISIGSKSNVLPSMPNVVRIFLCDDDRSGRIGQAILNVVKAKNPILQGNVQRTTAKIYAAKEKYQRNIGCNVTMAPIDRLQLNRTGRIRHKLIRWVPHRCDCPCRYHVRHTH